MELDETGFPQPTGRFETLAADTVILALGQDTDTEFLGRCPASSSSATGRWRSRRSMMTGCPGCSRAATWCRASAPSPSASATARRRRGTSTPGCAAPPPRARRSTTWRRFDKLHLWYFGDAARRQQPELEPEERVEGFGEVVGGLSAAGGGRTRRAGACRAATASSATAASAPARRTP